MCRYSYGNGRCANIDVEAYFCVGEKSCSITDFLGAGVGHERPEDSAWHVVPTNVWKIGIQDMDKQQ